MVTSASAQPTPCDISAVVEKLPTVKIVPARRGDVAEAFGLDVDDSTANDLVPVPYLVPTAQGSIVVKITSALENARASFDVGGTFALEGNANLLEALGLKGKADERRIAAENLSSIEDPAEKNAKMTELLTDDFVKTARRDPQFSYFVGSIFVLAGMNEQAMDWIENALDRGFFNYPFVAQQDPLLNNLRDTPQFNELLARMKTRWQAFVAATS